MDTEIQISSEPPLPSCSANFLGDNKLALQKLALQKMFLRVKRVKSNPYFYLVENERVEGQPNPVQRVVEYLGNQTQALRRLEEGDYSNKESLLFRVRAEAPGTGNRQGRPRKKSAE